MAFDLSNYETVADRIQKFWSLNRSRIGASKAVPSFIGIDGSTSSLSWPVFSAQSR